LERRFRRQNSEDSLYFSLLAGNSSETGSQLTPCSATRLGLRQKKIVGTLARPSSCFAWPAVPGSSTFSITSTKRKSRSARLRPFVRVSRLQLRAIMTSSPTFCWLVASLSSFSKAFSCLEGAIIIPLVPAPLQICARKYWLPRRWKTSLATDPL
jgi:hypothetical protein